MTAGDPELSIVWMTVPDAETGERIARTLVDERLIACANLLPGVTSVYRWEGAVHAEPELLVIMKTRRDRLARLFERAAELHPYQVPELVAAPLEASLPAYRAWVAAESSEEEA